MKVIGIEHFEFENKEGVIVKYCKVSVITPIPVGKGDGMKADIIPCKADKAKDLVVGDEVVCLYNKYGKVERFEYVG